MLHQDGRSVVSEREAIPDVTRKARSLGLLARVRKLDFILSVMGDHQYRRILVTLKNYCVKSGL